MGRLSTLLKLLLLVGAIFHSNAADAGVKPLLEDGDIIGFIGGTDVASAQYSGHLETLLLVQNSSLNLRIRNFGWEGDTVFEQPRDFGFPSLKLHLRNAGVTIAFLQFGRGEALNGQTNFTEFKKVYNALISQCLEQVPRIVLITPPPFEPGKSVARDLAKKNELIHNYASVIREIASKRELPLVDLLKQLGPSPSELTVDGVQLSPTGEAMIASAFLRQLYPANIKGELKVDRFGEWSNQDIEELRQVVIAKNKLWFNFWRPQNWAFLGGDRVSQPSSHDHRNPEIRWFPREMEKYPELIKAKEREIESLLKESE